MKLPTFLLLLPFFALSGDASAYERCTTHPVKQRIAHGVYLQQFALRCEAAPAPAVDAVTRARDWLALCQEAGGSAHACSAAYADLRRPEVADALRVARHERVDAIEPIASPLPARPVPDTLRWESGRLTNR